VTGTSTAWARFAHKKRNLFGVVLALSLGLVALFADFVASNRPIVLWRGSRIYLFANLIDYRELRGFDARHLEPGDWALWPPCRHGPYEIPDLASLSGPLPQPPSAEHPLGTDGAGRDTLARLAHGARVSLGVGLAAALVQVAIGVALGVLAGYLGGWTDLAVTRAAEVLLSFPLLLLLLAVQGVLERTTLFSTMAVIGLTRWADTCRLVRAEALRVRQLPYIEASRALGSSQLRTLVQHVLPSCLSPALVAITFGVGATVLLESALSFLGFGAPEPTASWGLLMAGGFQDILDPAARPLVLAPGFALFLTVIAFNLIGDGLREALDPRAQGAVEPSVLITSDHRRATSPAPSPEGGDPTPAKYRAPELK
jgi:peptide/nickel transport system permease protein